ncbi:hypothetical protein [Nocardia terpenica]|uniref:Uncharacterized protein n=1 Tax=Nocardia terpenica TaxID=455432 RepID=A0A164H4D7_9NOCA|nr:hypothetical protein [Nocardia terpenica]KZM68189.1 hypothetical protein AWN90_09665 [Nocardia terpenica]NQE88942.1 hypothetical protein [Nocardia terpenica]
MTSTNPGVDATGKQPRHGADNTTPRTASQADADIAALAIPAIVLGVAMLIAAFAGMDRIPGWADEIGAVLVYLAFFLYMSVAGRLTWWGSDTLIAQIRRKRGR